MLRTRSLKHPEDRGASTLPSTSTALTHSFPLACEDPQSDKTILQSADCDPRRPARREKTDAAAATGTEIRQNWGRQQC